MFGRKNRRIAALIARVELLAAQRDAAREDAATFRAATVRVAGRNAVLTAAEERHDADIDGLAARLDRALRGYARYRAAHAAETRRADRLQQRLDQALGLDSIAVHDGARWQQRRADKPKEVQP